MRLAFDKSGRHYDADGRLHIAVNNITKACVNPYSGREIMGGAQNGASLSLEPDRVYQLLRDPDALKAAVPTANNIQLLRKHVGVSAADPKKMDTIGSTGTDAAWNDPYITNSLVVWDAAAIAGVETKEIDQLSSSYRYTVIMEPGEYKGEKFDGRMVDIVFNHVTQVEEGRAGPDVAFGDEKPDFLKGPKMAVTKKAALLTTAAALEDQITRLAADAAPAVRHTLAGLAADAKKAADEMDEDDMAEDAAVMIGKAKDCAAEDEDEDGEEERKRREAADKKARDKKAKDAKRAKDKAARDARPDELDEDEDEDNEKVVKAEEKKKAEDRKAMDAAISAAILANDAKHAAIREATATVRPIVPVPLAMDSAEDIYRLGCEARGIDLAGVPAGSPPGVYKTLLDVASRVAESVPRLAHDAANGDVQASFMKRFPTAVIPRRA